MFHIIRLRLIIFHTPKFFNGIKKISGGVFYGDQNIKTVTIPSSVTSIGAQAFANCSNLSTIIIPDSIIEFGFGVFSGDNLLPRPFLEDLQKKYNTYSIYGNDLPLRFAIRFNK